MEYSVNNHYKIFPNMNPLIKLSKCKTLDNLKICYCLWQPLVFNCTQHCYTCMSIYTINIPEYLIIINKKTLVHYSQLNLMIHTIKWDSYHIDTVRCLHEINIHVYYMKFTYMYITNFCCLLHYQSEKLKF